MLTPSLAQEIARDTSAVIGFNVLITDGQAVGTVGITGAPDRVRRFGLVVKRQTEILLQESAILRSRLLRERALEDLLADIAAYDAELVEQDIVLFCDAELGYDLSV